MEYFAGLTEEQSQAVSAPIVTNVLVLANPGTGKTRVLTSRYLYLRNKGFRPEDIVLLTFTNKAAREMLGRLKGKIDYSLDLTGTFHHLACVLLRKAGHNFTILDDYHQLKAVTHLAEEVRLPVAPEYFLKEYSFRVNSLRNLNFTNPEYTFLAERYKEYKEAEGYYDFDDLLFYTLRLLQANPLSEKYILVDEFQDSSRIQVEILKTLRRYDNRFFAVGDYNQAVFSFAGADPDNLTNYEIDFAPVSTFHLSFNFRSTRPIILLCSDFIRLNNSCYDLKLHTEKIGPAPVFLYAPDPFSEAEKIADLVKEYYGKGRTAILCRVKRWFPLLEWKLSEKEIPFTVKGKTRCFTPSKDAVTLSTIHSAKGLEWDNVFVVGLCEGLFPHRKAVQEGKLQEERRLLYVGLSRARDRLWLSFVGNSRFLEELNHR
ncbi:MAG: ATP-dependent helicase [Candidatus Omnitrophota bacterium]